MIPRIKVILISVTLLTLILFWAGCSSTTQLSDGLYAKITTSRGVIILKLDYEKVPMTVANFVGLAEGTIRSASRDVPRYYDGLKFHRVIKDFMIQTGCPLGTGTGNPGYSFPDEFDPSLKHSGPGILSMANSGPDTNGSQFFITHKETPWLDNKHSVFGHVVEGQNVVDAIEQGDIMKKVEILRIGKGANSFIVTQALFDELVKGIKVKRDEVKRLAELEEQRKKEELQKVLDAKVDTSKLADGLYAKMATSRGIILLALEFEKVPMTVANFVGLAEGTVTSTTRPGVKYYDGMKFHRVIADFMIQGGCPYGNGSGGPGYKFADEFHPDLLHTGPGILSMANSGPGTNGSQFFITHKETPWLDNKHSVFGHVVEGQPVVNAIQQGDDLLAVEIIRKGKKAEAFVVNDTVFRKLQDEAPARQAKLAAERTRKIMESIKSQYPKAQDTPSGLKYVIQKEGSGERPRYGNTVTVHYSGKLLTGQEFDSSYKRGEPAQFKIGQVIEGWNEALQMMKKGAKWTLIIPPKLGYGEKGSGPIPPDSYLIFEVELLDFAQ